MGYDYSQALKRSQASRRLVSADCEVEVLGRTWDLIPEVFSPSGTTSTRAQIELLVFEPQTSFLEIGSGSGIIAVTAALAGCGPVVATDINARAVANTERNAQRHGVGDVVTSVHSDLFDQLDPIVTFDTVYWHSNNVWVPPDLPLGSIHELAFVDPGYETHRRYFRQVGRFVRPGGAALIGLSSRANFDDLTEVAISEGVGLELASETVVDEPEGPVSYSIHRIVVLEHDRRR